jgi:hypothetical protein
MVVTGVTGEFLSMRQWVHVAIEIFQWAKRTVLVLC